MRQTYFPSTISEFARFAQNLADRVASDPAALGVSTIQSEKLSETAAEFVHWYNKTVFRNSRTMIDVQRRGWAKTSFVETAREIVGIIRANPAVTSDQRYGLGLRDPAPRRRERPAAEEKPYLVISDVCKASLSLRLRLQKGRPLGAAGATIFVWLGENAPGDYFDWKFVMNTTKTRLVVRLRGDTPAGTDGRLVAFWRDSRDKPGPFSEPAHFTVGGGTGGDYAPMMHHQTPAPHISRAV
jgi:hypothetical protein